MDVSIINEYGYQEDYSFLNDVISCTLKKENVKNPIFSIIFVSLERIQSINKEYRGINRVTDVISFAFEDTKDVLYRDIRFLGDIYICIPKMEEQAIEYGHSKKRELAFLVVHGMLHLLGYDHQTKEDEKEMFQMQETILNEVGIKREVEMSDKK